MAVKILGKNKIAYHDYEIIKTYQAGIVLEGWEVKSIKATNFSLKEAHVRDDKGEMWVYGMYVSKWNSGEKDGMDETRTRKLLLHKNEVDRLIGQSLKKGYTIVPLNLHLDRGRIKMEIGLAKGLKQYDKRERLKEKDQKKQMDRDLKKMGY